MDSTDSQMSYIDWLQVLVTVLIREPIEEIVREELREAGITDSGDQSSTTDDPADSTSPLRKVPSGGVSAAAIGVGVLVLAGLVYWLRERTTESSEDTAGLDNRVTGPNSDTDGEKRSSTPAE